MVIIIEDPLSCFSKKCHVVGWTPVRPQERNHGHQVISFDCAGVFQSQCKITLLGCPWRRITSGSYIHLAGVAVVTYNNCVWTIKQGFLLLRPLSSTDFTCQPHFFCCLCLLLQPNSEGGHVATKRDRLEVVSLIQGREPGMQACSAGVLHPVLQFKAGHLPELVYDVHEGIVDILSIVAVVLGLVQ